MATATEIDTRIGVAKDRKKPKPSSAPQEDAEKEKPRSEVPGGAELDEDEYTEHLLVPIQFKERLERIAQRVNQERRRLKLPKRTLGWFVVYYLSPVLDRLEAEEHPSA
jgi:hypothetical protein